MKKFTIPIKPVGKGRPRFIFRGSVYTPEKTKTFEAEFRKWFRYFFEGQFQYTEKPIRVEIEFHYKKYKLKTVPRAQKPDIDNLVKACLDSLNGVCFKDDNQVVQLIASKYNSVEDKIVFGFEEV